MLNTIGEHISISGYTNQLNNYLKVVIFCLYYIISPVLMIGIYLTLSDKSDVYFRIVFYFVISFGTSVTFAVTLMSSRVTHSARKPLKYLHRYLIENHMTVRQRLKTLNLIERLSGPDIGFYCLDLFPMNSYEFYLFVTNCVSNYLLISNLIG